jgi:hypothetical protein
VAASTTLTVPIGSTAGDALVAMIAMNTGGSVTVSSVTDSSGATWTKGPIGYLSGANTRVEIWYRLNAPAITSVTITPSTSKSIGATISEWSGIAAVDVQAGSGSASSTTASTPSITTTNPTDLVIGAVNYPTNTSATLTTAGYTSLNNFPSGTGVHGFGAYKTTSTTGSQQASWNLNTGSGGSGGAILAMKAA